MGMQGNFASFERFVAGVATGTAPTPDPAAARLTGLIKDVRVVPVEGGPHNIGWTFPEVVNPALLEFLGR